MQLHLLRKLYPSRTTISGVLIALGFITLFASAVQGELSEAEREAIKSELLVLQEQLGVLRNNPAAKLDQWADANVFIKGIAWALDPGPIENSQDRELLQTGLRRARERMEALKAGRSTWTEKKGRTIRGFVSNVDGSTQPYGLIVPAGYDSSKVIWRGRLILANRAMDKPWRSIEWLQSCVPLRLTIIRRPIQPPPIH